MIGLLCFILAVLASPFKSATRLEAENAALRHQLILRRKVKGRALLTPSAVHTHHFHFRPRFFKTISKVGIRSDIARGLQGIILDNKAYEGLFQF
jgi:hypothetical protein